MKVKIKLTSPVLELKHHVSASQMLQEIQKKRQDEISAAVKYCVENDCKGYKAITSGLFPTIKNSRTINRCLPKENQSKKAKPVIMEGEEKSYCHILTTEKENSLANYFKNKNRYHIRFSSFYYAWCDYMKQETEKKSFNSQQLTQ